MRFHLDCHPGLSLSRTGCGMPGSAIYFVIPDLFRDLFYTAHAKKLTPALSRGDSNDDVLDSIGRSDTLQDDESLFAQSSYSHTSLLTAHCLSHTAFSTFYLHIWLYENIFKGGVGLMGVP